MRWGWRGRYLLTTPQENDYRTTARVVPTIHGERCLFRSVFDNLNSFCWPYRDVLNISKFTNVISQCYERGRADINPCVSVSVRVLPHRVSYPLIVNVWLFVHTLSLNQGFTMMKFTEEFRYNLVGAQLIGAAPVDRPGKGIEKGLGPMNRRCAR